MKSIIALGCLVWAQLLTVPLAAQNSYPAKVTFAEVRSNDSIVQLDDIKLRLHEGQKNRIVLWQDDGEALSLIYSLKETKKKRKVKTRFEVLEGGRWKMVTRERPCDGGRCGKKRWGSVSETSLEGMITDGVGFNESFELSGDRVLHLNGMLEVRYK